MTDALSLLVTFLAIALTVAAGVLWVGQRLFVGAVALAEALDKRWSR